MVTGAEAAGIDQMKKTSRLKKIAMLSCLGMAVMGVLFWVLSHWAERSVAVGGGQNWILVRSSNGDLAMARIIAREGKSIDSGVAKGAVEQVLLTHRYQGDVGNFLGFALYDQIVPKDDPTAYAIPSQMFSTGGLDDKGPAVRPNGLFTSGVAWCGMLVVPWWFVVVAAGSWPTFAWVKMQLKEDKGPRRRRWLRNRAIDQAPPA